MGEQSENYEKPTKDDPNVARIFRIHSCYVVLSRQLLIEWPGIEGTATPHIFQHHWYSSNQSSNPVLMHQVAASY